MLSFAYIVNFTPFEEKMMLYMDLLNEVATILLIDICFIFTPLEPSATRQYKFGYLFLLIVIMTVAI